MNTPSVLRRPPKPEILWRMINHSSHEVKITFVGTAPQRRNAPGFFVYRPLPLEMPVPIPIGPRDSQIVWTTPDKLPATLDLGRKIRGVVATSDGKTFKSKRVRARTLVEDD